MKVVSTLKEPRAGTPVFPLTQRSVILLDKVIAGREWIPIFRRVSDLVPESFRIVSLSVAWGYCLNTGFWVFFEVYTIKEQYFLSCILHSGDAPILLYFCSHSTGLFVLWISSFFVVRHLSSFSPFCLLMLPGPVEFMSEGLRWCCTFYGLLLSVCGF